MAKNNFEDFKINIKIKLSALWTSVMFCYIYGDYFELYVPKKVEGLLSGDNLLNSPYTLLAATCMLTIPALLIFLSLVLSPTICRIANIIFGIFFTVLMLLIAITSWSEWRIFYVLLALVESVLTGLIVWYAIKWPKTKN